VLVSKVAVVGAADWGGGAGAVGTVEVGGVAIEGCAS